MPQLEKVRQNEFTKLDVSKQEKNELALDEPSPLYDAFDLVSDRRLILFSSP